MPANETVPEIPPLTLHVDTGTLYLGDQQVTGLASVGTAWNTASFQERINKLEDKLDRLSSAFTADFARELIGRCEQFVSNQELTGMTDEEFEAEICSLLFSGGA